jgi:hypothetical protein
VFGRAPLTVRVDYRGHFSEESLRRRLEADYAAIKREARKDLERDKAVMRAVDAAKLSAQAITRKGEGVRFACA